MGCTTFVSISLFEKDITYQKEERVENTEVERLQKLFLTSLKICQHVLIHAFHH
jgi:hypothetical protein